MDRRATLVAAVLASSVSVGAVAANVSYDYATVLDVEPITKHVRVSTPREECWDERVVYRERSRGNTLAPVVGGILGGAFGNAVGHHKRNKQVGAVVGAILGASIGHTVSAGNRTRRHEGLRHHTEERCVVRHEYHEEERVIGYHVRYRYNDETYSTRTDRDPGETIRVRVSVAPVF